MYMANVIKTLMTVQPFLNNKFLDTRVPDSTPPHNLKLAKPLKLINHPNPRMNKMFCPPIKQPQQAFWNHS